MYIGIDASINCTGITIFKDNKYHFYYYNSDKVAKKRKLTHKDFLFNFNIPLNKKENCENMILIEDKNELSSTIEFDLITDEILRLISSYNPEEIYIGMEGYSYGSTGLTFNIAEFCGNLKIKLINNLDNLKSFAIYKPTNIKKFATGNGRSKKEAMLKSFREINSETTNQLLDIFDINNNEYIRNSKTPIEDLVDSYFICKKVILSNI